MTQPAQQERRATDRIRYLLNEWASYYTDGAQGGYPRSVSFANERVQESNRSTDTLREIPPEIARLNGEIDKLPPSFRCILALEYRDKQPQKTKAARLQMNRQVFCTRLAWIHEQLTYTMWGIVVSDKK